MLLDTLNYKQWVDRRTLDAVAQIDPQRCAQTLAFACQQLHHMVRVEALFRARLLGHAGA